MKLNYLNCFCATTLAATLVSNAAIITLTEVSPRVGGPAAGPDVSGTAGNFAGSNSNAALVLNITVVNQNLDGDGVFDDTFTFDLIATTSNANGVSIWGQGTNNSTAAGGNSFSSLDGVSFTVANVSGTTSIGDIIVFDGITGATVASGAGNATINRTIDAAGLTYVMSAGPTGGFNFVQNAQDFAPMAAITFSNQGGDAGSLVARGLDLQFSTVPEPSSALLLGFAGGMLALRRRK